MDVWASTSNAQAVDELKREAAYFSTSQGGEFDFMEKVNAEPVVTAGLHWCKRAAVTKCEALLCMSMQKDACSATRVRTYTSACTADIADDWAKWLNPSLVSEAQRVLAADASKKKKKGSKEKHASSDASADGCGTGTAAASSSAKTKKGGEGEKHKKKDKKDKSHKKRRSDRAKYGEPPQCVCWCTFRVCFCFVSHAQLIALRVCARICCS